MTEIKAIYGFDEPLDLGDKLADEQAECAVLKLKLADIRDILGGRQSPDWPKNAAYMIDLIKATLDEVRDGSN